MRDLILVGFGEEAEVDLRSPDPGAISLVHQFPFAEEPGEVGGSESFFPGPFRAGDDDGKAGLGETGEEPGAVVVGRTDKRDLAVAVGVRPALRWRKVRDAIVCGLNLDDVARAALFEVGHADVALGAVEIERWDGLLV